MSDEIEYDESGYGDLTSYADTGYDTAVETGYESVGDESTGYDTSSSDSAGDDASSSESSVEDTSSYDTATQDTATSYADQPSAMTIASAAQDPTEAVGPVGVADSGAGHVCAGPGCCGSDAPIPTDLADQLGSIVTGPVDDPPDVPIGPAPVAVATPIEAPTAAPVVPAAPSPVAPAAAAAGLPPGAQVVEVDSAGRPTHIRLDHPVAPTQEMVTMGGNNPFYIGTQSATGDPYADPSHVTSSTPVAPGIEWVTVGGQPARGIRPEDYPAPGSAAETVARMNLGIMQDMNDATLSTIDHVTRLRDHDGDLDGFGTSNGNIYPTSGLGNAVNQAENIDHGVRDQDTGPTIN